MTVMTGESVRIIYGTWQARWYDPFKRLWNVLAASGAEKDLSTFLRQNLDESKTVLELACGTAVNLEKIFSLNLKFRSYLGLDFSPDMLRIARRKFHGYPNVEFREQDITKFKVISGKFFLIFFFKPRWYLKFWIAPLARLLLRSRCVRDEEVGKFKNVRKVRRYSSNMVTVVEIYRAST